MALDVIPERAVLRRHHLRQAVESVLSDCVRSVQRRPDLACDRGNIDDPSETVPDEVRKGTSGTPERGHQIDVPAELHRLVGLLMHRDEVARVTSPRHRSAVVHQDVETAELRDRLIDEAVTVSARGHVGGDEAHSVAVLAPTGKRYLRLLTRAAVHHDPGTGAQEPVGDGAPDATGTTGDERDLIVERTHRRLPRDRSGDRDLRPVSATRPGQKLW